MGGSTTPITMAGSLVVGIAEALAGVAVVQAAHPGCPVFICLIPSIMDLKTGDFTGGAPEDTLMGAAAGDIGEFYGLPTQCGVNASGAKEPGWQTAMEDVTTTFVSMMAGVDMLTGVGMVAGGRVFSFAEMLLGAEIAGLARALVSGATDRASVAARLELSARDFGEGAAADADGSAGPEERVRDLLATHVPPRLDEALDEEMRTPGRGCGIAGLSQPRARGDGAPRLLVTSIVAGVRVPHDDTRRLRLTSGRDIDRWVPRRPGTGVRRPRGPGGGIATKATDREEE